MGSCASVGRSVTSPSSHRVSPSASSSPLHRAPQKLNSPSYATNATEFERYINSGTASASTCSTSRLSPSAELEKTAASTVPVPHLQFSPPGTIEYDDDVLNSSSPSPPLPPVQRHSDYPPAGQPPQDYHAVERNLILAPTLSAISAGNNDLASDTASYCVTRIEVLPPQALANASATAVPKLVTSPSTNDTTHSSRAHDTSVRASSGSPLSDPSSASENPEPSSLGLTTLPSLTSSNAASLVPSDGACSSAEQRDGMSAEALLSQRVVSSTTRRASGAGAFDSSSEQQVERSMRGDGDAPLVHPKSPMEKSPLEELDAPMDTQDQFFALHDSDSLSATSTPRSTSTPATLTYQKPSMITPPPLSLRNHSELETMSSPSMRQNKQDLSGFRRQTTAPGGSRHLAMTALEVQFMQGRQLLTDRALEYLIGGRNEIPKVPIRVENVKTQWGKEWIRLPQLSDGTCQICYEQGSMFMKPCGNIQCSGQYCRECLNQTALSMIEASLYACPYLKCPECRNRVPTVVWRSLVPEDAWEKYCTNARALLNFRCPDCDEVGSLLLHQSDDNARSQMVSAEEQSCWVRWGQDVTSVNLIETIVKAKIGPSSSMEDRPGDATVLSPTPGAQRHFYYLLLMVDDIERRCTLLLQWLRRFPYFKTPCCEAKMCFKCKTQGWHPGHTCEERMRKTLGSGAAVQWCPKCGVPTVKSEGCDHIVCCCGASWTWMRSSLLYAAIHGLQDHLLDALGQQSPIIKVEVETDEELQEIKRITDSWRICHEFRDVPVGAELLRARGTSCEGLTNIAYLMAPCHLWFRPRQEAAEEEEEEEEGEWEVEDGSDMDMDDDDDAGENRDDMDSFNRSRSSNKEHMGRRTVQDQDAPLAHGTPLTLPPERPTLLRTSNVADSASFTDTLGNAIVRKSVSSELGRFAGVRSYNNNIVVTTRILPLSITHPSSSDEASRRGSLAFFGSSPRLTISSPRHSTCRLVRNGSGGIQYLEVSSNADKTLAFGFDALFERKRDADVLESDQKAVYDRVCTPFVKNAFDANSKDNMFIAYGARNSGNLFTIIGDVKSQDEKGLLPRFVEKVFSVAHITMARQGRKSAYQMSARLGPDVQEVQFMGLMTGVRVDVAAVEIANDAVRDVLDWRKNDMFPAGVNPNKNLAGCLSLHEIKNPHKIASFITRVTKERKSKASEANSIFTVRVATPCSVSYTHFVDLHLPSDNYDASALITLLRCLGSLTPIRGGQAPPSPLLPYDDSALTRYLRSAIAAYPATCVHVMATVSPSHAHLIDTLHSLDYVSQLCPKYYPPTSGASSRSRRGTKKEEPRTSFKRLMKQVLSSVDMENSKATEDGDDPTPSLWQRSREKLCALVRTGVTSWFNSDTLVACGDDAQSEHLRALLLRAQGAALAYQQPTVFFLGEQRSGKSTTTQQALGIISQWCDNRRPNLAKCVNSLYDLLRPFLSIQTTTNRPGGNNDAATWDASHAIQCVDVYLNGSGTVIGIQVDIGVLNVARVCGHSASFAAMYDFFADSPDTPSALDENMRTERLNKCKRTRAACDIFGVDPNFVSRILSAVWDLGELARGKSMEDEEPLLARVNDALGLDQEPFIEMVMQMKQSLHNDAAEIARGVVAAETHEMSVEGVTVNPAQVTAKTSQFLFRFLAEHLYEKLVLCIVNKVNTDLHQKSDQKLTLVDFCMAQAGRTRFSTRDTDAFCADFLVHWFFHNRDTLFRHPRDQSADATVTASAASRAFTQYANILPHFLTASTDAPSQGTLSSPGKALDFSRNGAVGGRAFMPTGTSFAQILRISPDTETTTATATRASAANYIITHTPTCQTTMAKILSTIWIPRVSERIPGLYRASMDISRFMSVQRMQERLNHALQHSYIVILCAGGDSDGDRGSQLGILMRSTALNAPRVTQFATPTPTRSSGVDVVDMSAHTMDVTSANNNISTDIGNNARAAYDLHRVVGEMAAHIRLQNAHPQDLVGDLQAQLRQVGAERDAWRKECEYLWAELREHRQAEFAMYGTGNMMRTLQTQKDSK
eukprot:GEMP01000474.1.p1 GENE.GEMP01000474.1~~GEMP01000474.1.p1  ORF type:complete len:2032 (+),score=444.33 GEMP01000474.1:366-6461(+)